MNVAIWWIRRDLRLADNPALRSALEEGRPVLPVFIEDARLMASAGKRRRAFLLGGLRALDADLRRRGSRLVYASGAPVMALAQLAGALAGQGLTLEVICAGEDYSPYARRRDAQVARALPLRLVLDVTAQHPSALRKPDGTPYRVFTPFKHAWMRLPFAPGSAWNPPVRFPDLPGLDSLPELPPAPEEGPDALAGFPPGAGEAQRRLAAFLDGPIFAYGETRDRLDLDGTSTLSPYLRFGMLSPARAVQAAQLAAESAPDPGARAGCLRWLDELIWREFYLNILENFPFVLKMAFNPALRDISWRDDPAGLAAWQAGQTGYPIVDACMRQLAQTGWMHNRGRMIVASFLTKDLLINWQVGEQWFLRQLVDGDPAANNGGWQWTAGVGTDAAPYFRIFNPVLQGKKFDPHGAFVRRWVPELAHLPGAWVHTPWLTPQPAPGYPPPVVDHKLARSRTLGAYQASARRCEAD